MNWVKEFPTQQGYYWFYGQRYQDAKYELLFVNVRKGSGDFLLYIEGSGFLFKEEVGEKWAFAKASLPDFPKFD